MSISIAPIGRLRTGARVSAMRNEFYLGSTVTWFGEFRDPVTGAASDPTGEVEFDFLWPGAVLPDAIIGAKSATGIFAAPRLLITAGLWTVRLFANGARVDERTFVVEQGAFPEPPPNTGTVRFTDNIRIRLTEDGRARLTEET
ncbi:hypothetical protein [Falsiroseomonas tokyonensis]|uniref:Uncharacterized protein n=1 Tax=Falsiroseomonas tokyonensis TaxID=430521 RepID=A0ABV7BYT7_9PROT|nr:hypothetical protein [Falsiroseomonas tokyonensis]MBU8540801.1 hypothetical protein [Falsiroseomonas tokyonensis]